MIGCGPLVVLLPPAVEREMSLPTLQRWNSHPHSERQSHQVCERPFCGTRRLTLPQQEKQVQPDRHSGQEDPLERTGTTRQAEGLRPSAENRTWRLTILPLPFLRFLLALPLVFTALR